METSYSMADELKHVLSFYKDEKQKAKLDILQTPDIFIDMRSTVKEVQQWLKAKQFSGRYSLLLFPTNLFPLCSILPLSSDLSIINTVVTRNSRTTSHI